MLRRSLLLLTCWTAAIQAAPHPQPKAVGDLRQNLLDKLRQNHSNQALQSVKKTIFSQGNKAVPALIEVMKSAQYPDKNRWVATFMLGQIMGQKAVPFIAKFTEHPHWVLRLASLKTLLALGAKQNQQYLKALKDKSMLVRVQALDNIRKLKLKETAREVWAMLLDPSNYTRTQKGSQRMPILGQVVRTVGELAFRPATATLIKMIAKPQYQDLHPDIEYALGKITQQSSAQTPDKAQFWLSYAQKNKIQL